jgi:hypothetical protein
MKIIDPTPVTMPKSQIVLQNMGLQAEILLIHSFKRAVRYTR